MMCREIGSHGSHNAEKNYEAPSSSLNVWDSLIAFNFASSREETQEKWWWTLPSFSFLYHSFSNEQHLILKATSIYDPGRQTFWFVLHYFHCLILIHREAHSSAFFIRHINEWRSTLLFPFEVSFNFDAWIIYDFIVYDIDFLFVT